MSKTILLCALYASFIAIFVDYSLVVDGLGVNWGTISGQQLPPKVVVQMLKDNGIKKVKLFNVDKTTLTALQGTGIEVMVAIANDLLDDMCDLKTAKAWVKENITSYTSMKNGVNIKLVGVGNEPFLQAYKNTLINVTFPALKNIQTALNEAGVGKDIKATIPLNADVYYSPPYNPVPSAGIFRPDVADQIKQIAKFLNDNDAPFMVNIYPFLGLYLNYPQFPIDYCFFDGVANPVKDNGLVYTNYYDANYDTCVSALKGIGYGNLTVMVGEIGWPTDGDMHANSDLAWRFYKGFLPRVILDKGTPLRPNASIEVYIFALLDEGAKSLLPGNFERHWGIFTYDGQPKFPMDLSGKGKNVTLAAAKNVNYLPKKWCQLNPNAKDLSKLSEKVDYACQNSDCTALGFGCSCNDLDANGNASYAFNMYFQVNNQMDGSCDFGGLGTVTSKNLSQGSCKFPVLLANTPQSPPTMGPSAAPGMSGMSPDGSTPALSAPSPSLGVASSETSPLLYAIMLLFGFILF